MDAPGGMVRVYINGRFLGQRMTGVQRYAYETLLALDALLGDEGDAAPAEWTVLAPPGTPVPVLRHISFCTVGRGSGHLWEQVWLPMCSRGGLLWSFCPTGPLLCSRQVVTMHDASVYAVSYAFGWRFRLWYRLLLPILARRTPLTMTVSEFSRRELCRYLSLPPARLRASGEGWQHVMRVTPDPGVLQRHGLAARRYVLAVSSLSPHKNLAVLARALRHLPSDVRVVVAGAVNESIFGHDPKEGAAGLTQLGYVTDAELLALYTHASVFVFPSIYEGFGLPPLEAMALGCPVICAQAAAMPEVCGEGALYFEPHDAQQLAALIASLWSDPGRRQAVVDKGQAQLDRHSWHAAARNHLQAFCMLQGRDAPAKRSLTGPSAQTSGVSSCQPRERSRA